MPSGGEEPSSCWTGMGTFSGSLPLSSTGSVAVGRGSLKIPIAVIASLKLLNRKWRSAIKDRKPPPAWSDCKEITKAAYEQKVAADRPYKCKTERQYRKFVKTRAHPSDAYLRAVLPRASPGIAHGRSTFATSILLHTVDLAGKAPCAAIEGTCQQKHPLLW